MPEKKAEGSFNRITGLVVVEVRSSNPNGDPDLESDPRTLEADGRGVISPVSFKRKLRDLVSEKAGPVWRQWAAEVDWEVEDPSWRDSGGFRYEILETRGRNRDEIAKMSADAFGAQFWDARVFGNTFLESLKAGKDKRDVSHFISTGAVQVGVGLSVSPVEIDRWTQTNKAGVQEGKDRGMAPLGFRVVRHAVYGIPVFVNPSVARKTGMTVRDLSLLRFLLPYAYSHTASAARPFVNVLHAWWAEHLSPLGSCPDGLIIDALMPRRIGDASTPSTRLDGDYMIPTEADLAPALAGRLGPVTDAVAPVD